MKMQQEELKASNEEIESSNEELEEQNAQIRQQSGELEKSKTLLEEKAKELELANRYKSEFLANMSHELRTPLNSLLILARSLASNETKNLTEEQVEEARIIHNGGLELLGLINDILDLSKVEAGKLNILSEDAYLDGIVKKLQQQFDPVAKEKNLAFPIAMADGLPAMLHTDAQRVEQILKNLLSNAFKFTEKGSVTLKIFRPDKQAELQRSSLDYESAIGFSVIDTGIGIEAAKFKDIFEAFQQEDGSTDRHYGGTGLGLTIARKFAHLLGGEIHVASEKGRGSAFTLMLPVKMSAREENGTPFAASDIAQENTRTELKTMPRASVAEFIADDRKNIDGRDKVLLIIEDDRNFAAMLVKIAHRRGYKCLAAGDGKTGLLLAVEQPVTAIILDLRLPDIDGMQVLDQLKHDLRSRHIPVHIITGRDAGGNVTSLRKGAIGYLIKPVEAEGIEGAFSRIEELLQSEMKQVLVIEDDENNRIAIQSLLKKKDIRLTLAGMGAEALAELEKTRFDCVILDLRLPDMTGFEWLEMAEKQMGATGLPPVVVYTAKELTEEENRRLNRYTGNIIIKGAKSPERLLDEVTLFLHSVESTLSKDQQEMIRMQHDPDKVLQGRTVLLTDDDLRNTFALSKLLKKHGMNVVIADNGKMALEKLKEDASIEIVIMDIMMPVMDGYQAMREIRGMRPRQGLPILALTARAMPEEQEKCMTAGANDYLTKPVDVERLLTLLRVWLFRQEMAA
ncbi:MAG: response regulator [Proteobacteria bacterium]|nr:response regulator [Pseudomonadota bacterium]